MYVLEETAARKWCDIAGIIYNEEVSIYEIESVDELRSYSTACGKEGNKPFTSQVLYLLRGASKIIVICTRMFDDKEESIQVLFCDLNPDDGERFSELVGKAGGSLEFDDGDNGTGLYYYESE